MRVDRLALHGLDVEDVEVERALRRDFRVLLPQGAGRRVARVLERLFLQQLLPLAERAEALLRHVDLAAHLQKRDRLGERFRDRADRADILRHVLARHAVAARRAARIHAVDVFERHRKPVELRLDDVDRVFDDGPHAAVEVAQLLLRKGVVQAFHRHGVRDGCKRVVRRAAHAVRRRILRFEFRKSRLQIFEAAVQHVVFVVADFRRVLGVVLFVVVFDLLPQCGELLLCLFLCHEFSPFSVPGFRRRPCAAEGRLRLLYHKACGNPMPKTGFRKKIPLSRRKADRPHSAAPRPPAPIRRPDTRS